MRVLHLLDPAAARPTDYGRRAQALLAELRVQGVYTVHVAAQAGKAPHPCWPQDWHLYDGAAPRLPAWLPDCCSVPFGIAAMAARLRQLTRLTRPDLIHVHAAGAHATAAWPVARLARLPLVVEAERRGGACAAPAIDRFLCARADAIVAPSIDVRAALRADGLRGHRIAVLPPAADVPAAARIDPGPPGLVGAPLLAYAGPLERSDGIDLLLAALLVLRRRHPALRLLVAGAGAQTDALEARVAASGLRGHVLFAGLLSGRRTADALARADVAVFPGLPGSAGARVPSRHLLNAMAQGCTVVASDLPSHRELLVHGHSGLLFPAGSATVLVQLLERLLGQLPTERRHPGMLGQAASAFIAARHSWSATAARYRRLYEAVLTEARC